MKLSKIFEVISNEIYGANNRYAHKKIDILKNYHEVICTDPILIRGEYSIYEEDTVKFEEKDLTLKNTSILVYDETGHTGEWCIREYSSLEEVEKFILSGAGYFNMFCTHIVVFSYDAVLSFSVYYMDDYEKIVLDKDDELLNTIDLKIEWESKPIY